MTLGDPVFLLLHGAWHDHTCWQPLQPHLEALGHTILTPDLPGHGEKAADNSKISLKAYSGYITQYIENIEDNVILVGHSMSGMVISQVAEMLPERIQRLAYLNAYLPRDSESLFDLIKVCRDHAGPALVEQSMLMSQDKRICRIADKDITPLFYNRCPPESAGLIPATFPPQATLPLSAKVSLSQGNYGQVPKTYICCQADRVIPVRHQRFMLSRQPCDEMIQLDADHSPFLSCPEELARVLHSVSLPA